MESAPITGGECFHPLKFSTAIVRVPEFLAAPRVKTRTEEPVRGSQGVLCLLSLALERKWVAEGIQKGKMNSKESCRGKRNTLSTGFNSVLYRNTYMKNIEIIRMTTDHHSNAIKLWSECEINIEKEDQFECIKQFLSSPQSMGFVATIDGKCIGAALCATDSRYGYIHHLAVDKAYRNKGLGRNLVSKCKEFIFSFEGINGIAIFVWNRNQTGHHFWNSNGFELIDGLNVLAFKRN